MNVRELSLEMERLIPKSLSCEWDNDGLLCAPDLNREIKKVLFALDVTPEIADKAISEGYDAVFSHHPLIFKSITRLISEGDDATALKLYCAGISVFSYHTRLDAVGGGVADCLTELAGLKNTETVPGTEGMLRIGDVKCEELGSFSERVKDALGSPILLFASAGRRVSRIAVSPGDGKDFVAAAVSVGADTFLTGRLSYNIMCDAPKYGINLIEAGHYYTERPVLERLSKTVGKLTGAETVVADSLNINIR